MDGPGFGPGPVYPGRPVRGWAGGERGGGALGAGRPRGSGYPRCARQCQRRPAGGRAGANAGGRRGAGCRGPSQGPSPASPGAAGELFWGKDLTPPAGTGNWGPEPYNNYETPTGRDP